MERNLRKERIGVVTSSKMEKSIVVVVELSVIFKDLTCDLIAPQAGNFKDLTHQLLRRRNFKRFNVQISVLHKCFTLKSLKITTISYKIS